MEAGGLEQAAAKDSTTSLDQHNEDPPPLAQDEGPTSSCENMLTVVRSALDDWELTYQLVERANSNPLNPLIEFGMSGQYTNYRAIISIDMEDDIFAVYYVCPLKIIENRRRELARYLAGANYKVMVGHFDLDFRDGEVRFKISVILRGTVLSQEMVKQMIGISMKTMDKFFPGMMACEFGDISADNALLDLERPANHHNPDFPDAEVTQ
ncbi:hypothetical protein ACA910_004922 [Epithemia clementina (nom. ined.)]